MGDKEVQWSFWLQLPEGSAMPTYEQVQVAWRRALPDFDVQFSITDMGGNPRDGYLHGVNVTAQQGTTALTSDAGVWGSFYPDLRMDEPEYAKYEMLSFAPWVKSSEAWPVQRQWWRRLAEEFSALGFRDMTMQSDVFADPLRAIVRELGGDERTLQEV